jgi:hypothetical protein
MHSCSLSRLLLKEKHRLAEFRPERKQGGRTLKIPCGELADGCNDRFDIESGVGASSSS